MNRPKSVFGKIIIGFIIGNFFTQTLLISPAQAVIVNSSLRQQINLPLLKGLRVLPSDGLKLDFLLQQDGSQIDRDCIERLVRIFLSGLTFDANQIWVNLSPYEDDRVMPSPLTVTELGFIMAQQDYLLKQRASALTNPDTPIGRLFWSQSQKEQKFYGSVNTFTKVWIVPDRADVYYQGNNAVIEGVHLKVLSQEDYLALKNHHGDSTSNTQHFSHLVRDIICPVLEKEVNGSAEFSPLRSIFNALILAYWFKTFHGSQISSLNYIGSNKIKGIDLVDHAQVKGIYQQYQKFYKKGAYNFIREDIVDGQIIPRKYFSGGLWFDPARISFKFGGIKKVLGRSLLTAVTVSFLALVSPHAALANQPMISPAPNVHSVEMIKQNASSSEKRILSFMTEFEQRGRIVKSPLPNQVIVPLTVSDEGKIGQKLVHEIIVESKGYAKPVFGGGTYQVILNGGSVWVQHANGQQVVVNTVTINSYKIQQGDILFLQNRNSNIVSAGAGAPPPPKDQLEKTNTGQDIPGAVSSIPVPVTVKDAWGTYFDNPETETKTPPKVSLPVPEQEFVVSAGGEAGYVAGKKPNYTNLVDIRTTENLGNSYSLFGGLNLNEPVLTPYVGVHHAGSELNEFLETDFSNIHGGFETRPVYNKGWSYTEGLSGMAYDTPKGHRLALMADGYLSFKLSRLFGSNEILDKTYLSSMLEGVLSQEGSGIGGGTKLTYNDRWEAFAEISPMRNMSDMRGMVVGDNHQLYNYRLGVAYKWSESINLLAQWVEPIGHMGEKRPPNVMLGFTWSLGPRNNSHGGDLLNRPTDYSRVTDQSVGAGGPPPDKSMVTDRRWFLQRMAGLTVAGFANIAAGGIPSRFDQVNKVDPNSQPICSLPIVILSVGDPLAESHMVYVKFMYWYVIDKTNQSISYEDPQKQRFLRMSAWQWEDFLNQRTVTQRHEALVRVVQEKMIAEAVTANNIAARNTIHIDGKLFSARYRQWMNQWIIYLLFLSRDVDFYDYIQNIQSVLNRSKQEQIKSFLKNFVTAQDVVKAAMGKKIGNVSLWDNFFEENPAWVVFAAQTKFNSIGYQVPVDGKLNTPTINAIRKEIESIVDKASIVKVMPGGINFGSLDKIISWETEEGKRFMVSANGNNVVGMTFKILDIRNGRIATNVNTERGLYGD